jgi:hypothetical protein
MTQTSTRITEIARVIVTVSDQDRALEFYIAPTPITRTSRPAGSTWTPKSCGIGDPVPPMFFFRDPDGNTLHVAEER